MQANLTKDVEGNYHLSDGRTVQAGASKRNKRAIQASHRKASSPCICKDAEGNVVRIITRTKTEHAIVKRVAPQVEVVRQMTYAERMAKYGVIGNVE